MRHPTTRHRPTARPHPYLTALAWALIITLTVACAQPAAAGARASASPPETYGQYSQMWRGSYGAYYDDAGNRSGEWDWTYGQPGWRGVSWGDPSYREWFARSDDGSWMVLDGWRGNGTYYTLRVTGEWYGRYDCTGMTPFKAGKDGGRQHYVYATAQGSRCLVAEGTITEASSGKVVNFRHQQQWSAPFDGCTTRYFTDRRCISQTEKFWDDNGTPFQLKVHRTVYLAKGLGMAFWIRDYRTEWRAFGKDYR